MGADPPPAEPPASEAKAPGALPIEVVNDPARTGFDPNVKWWMNYFRALTGKMTTEGQFHFHEWRNKVNEERDCKRCEKDRDWLLAHSPIVRFLSEKIQDLNGKLDASNVYCRRCPTYLLDNGQVRQQGGGFSPDHGILICANEMLDRKQMEDTLAHEMIHAWDHLRWKVDWHGDKDLTHAACTEIRATMLSGECRWTREALMRGNWTVTQQFQKCVRQRAISSVLARARCKDEAHAAKVVDRVWDSCFADTRPFDEVYR